MLRDLSFALRMLARERLFTSVALLMLALGIGANTAVFSVVSAVLLRALPYRDVDRMVDLYADGTASNRAGFSITELEAFARGMESLEGLAIVATQSVNLTGSERPVRVRGAFVSSNFFELLSIAPRAGQFFTSADDRAGAERTALVSEQLWQERLAADPGRLGTTTLTFNGEPHRIVGVVPAEFPQPFDPERLDVWLPLSSYADGRGARNFYGIGYLNEGRPLTAAQAEATAITRQLAALDPVAHAGRTTSVQYIQELMASRSRPLLLSLFAATGVVLLIASANVGQLLLARGVEREREFSVRSALGASRWQLVRQLLTEATLLGALGGSLGLVVAQAGLALLRALPQNFVAAGDVAIDQRTLLFTLATSLLTVWAFALWPALQVSLPTLGAVLREGARGSGAGARWNRVRDAFVVLQVALSLVLVVGAVLLARSFRQLLEVDVGFDTAGLLTLEYRLPRSKYPERAAQAEAHRRILEEIQGVAGVELAALSIGLPFSGNSGSATLALPDRPAPPPGQEPKALYLSVTPEYFATLRVPVREGRLFGDGDRLGTEPVVIVSEGLAREHWPNRSALGKALHWVEDGTTATVVGVVGDVHHWEVDEPPVPQVYTSFAQQPHPFASLVARTSLEPLALAEPIREALWRVDPEQPVWKVRSLGSLVDRSLSDRRFLATLVGVFAGLALVLTWVGLYGILRYLTERRTPELAIRLALGATPASLVRSLTRQGMRLALRGLALGLGVAWAMTGLLEGLLYGVTASDLPTFLASAASLLPLTWLACYLPARRVARVNPMLTLRHD